MIIETSRGYVKLAVGERRIQVYGEAYYPKDKPWYFLASGKSIRQWENGVPVAADEINLIKQTLEKDFQDKGWHLEWG